MRDFKTTSAALLIASMTYLGCSTKLRNKRNFRLLKVFAEQPSVEFIVKPTPQLVDELNEVGQEVPKPFQFKPTIPVTYGVSGGYKWFGFSLGQASSLSNKELEEKGQTDFDDYQLHFNFAHIGIDLIYQNYTGFYTDEDAGTTEFDTLNLTNQIFPSTTFSRNGMNIFYISNPKKFSLSSAYDQSAYLNKSGYSWLTMFSAEQIKINRIPYILTDESDPDSGYHFAGFDTYGLKTGPGFTLWMGPIYTNLSLFAGLAYQTQSVQQLETDDPEVTNAPTLKGHSRFAIGLDPGGMFMVATAYLDYTEIPTEDYDVRFISGHVSFSVGSRF